MHPVDLMAHSLRELVSRTGVDPELIDDVIGGVVTAVGEQGSNLTRRAVLAAVVLGRINHPSGRLHLARGQLRIQMQTLRSPRKNSSLCVSSAPMRGSL